jgi:uncharacterized membrane protein YhhN
MKKILLGLFVVVATVQLIAQLTGNEILQETSKPLVMIVLGLYYFIVSGKERSSVVLAAILFSFGGDVLLMFPAYFIAGLVAFLIAHVFYILAYSRHQEAIEREEGLKGIQRVRFAFPIVLAGTGLIVILYPVIGDLRIPVMIYALVLTIMVLKALFRFGKTNVMSFTMVFTGAVLFMVSDSMIAINKFLSPFAGSGFWIMATYMVAQFFIIQGLLKHFAK